MMVIVVNVIVVVVVVVDVVVIIIEMIMIVILPLLLLLLLLLLLIMMMIITIVTTTLKYAILKVWGFCCCYLVCLVLGVFFGREGRGRGADVVFNFFAAPQTVSNTHVYVAAEQCASQSRATLQLGLVVLRKFGNDF